jgi:hypothetical protein
MRASADRKRKHIIPSGIQASLNARRLKFLGNRLSLIFQKLAGGGPPPYQFAGLQKSKLVLIAQAESALKQPQAQSAGGGKNRLASGVPVFFSLRKKRG